MNEEMRSAATSMIIASVLALILGFVMLLYPGGTMALMGAAFTVLQAMISIFILAYAISEATRHFKGGSRGLGIASIAIGVGAVLLVWIFDVRIVWIIFALFCILAGLGEIFGAFSMHSARYFLFLLGLLNIMVGAIVLKYPLALPLLIAWYVLFWGISRLLLALEIRRITA